MFWAIAYDTEYAMVDREDDRRLGIRTSAILFGHRDVAAVMLFHALFIATLLLAGWRLGLGVFYFAGVLVAAGLAGGQYRLLRDRDPAQCFRAFRHNNWVGAAVFAGIAAEFLFAGL